MASSVVPGTAAAAQAAEVGGNYCEHTGFAFCPKCDRRLALAKARRAAKAKLTTLHFIGAFPGAGPASAPVSPTSRVGDRDGGGGGAPHSDDDSSLSSDDDGAKAAERKRRRRERASVEAAAAEASRLAREDAETDEGTPCFRCCRRYTNLACALVTLAMVLLTTCVAAPLFYVAKHDYDTPIYGHTYIHCDTALQYDEDKWFFAGFDTLKMNAEMCQSMCTAVPAGVGEQTYRYFGLQYGSRCYCGNSFPENPQREEFCGLVCGADADNPPEEPREVCGDLDYSSMYILNCFEQFNSDTPSTFTDDPLLAANLTLKDTPELCDLKWETYELALLGLGGVAVAAGLAGMVLLYCRTVHVGIYSEENMRITIDELMQLFPRVSRPVAEAALAEARRNRLRATAILQKVKPKKVRRPQVRPKGEDEV